MAQTIPSFWSIFKNDYYCRYVRIFLVITLIVYIGLQIIHIPLKFNPNYLLILLFIELIVIYFRLIKIRRLFNFGTSVDGKVDRVSKSGAGFSSRTMVEYSYSFDGKEYNDKHPVSSGFEEGQTINCFVDQANPQKSIIADVFHKRSGHGKEEINP